MLKHLRSKNIKWVPEALGFDEEGKELLTYIEGEVPHKMPSWIWNENTLASIAESMRTFHDATVDFDRENSIWQLPSNEPSEVICHNDFAPYNCVFKNEKWAGLIDFELCSPGSRLWDISYAVYRFAPFMPSESKNPYEEYCHFNKDDLNKRVELFLETYSRGDSKYRYSLSDLRSVLSERLNILAKWPLEYGTEINNKDLIRNASMYKWHSEWVELL